MTAKYQKSGVPHFARTDTPSIKGIRTVNYDGNFDKPKKGQVIPTWEELINRLSKLLKWDDYTLEVIFTSHGVNVNVTRFKYKRLPKCWEFKAYPNEICAQIGLLNFIKSIEDNRDYSSSKDY